MLDALLLFRAAIPRSLLLGFDDPQAPTQLGAHVSWQEFDLGNEDRFLDLLATALDLHARLEEKEKKKPRNKETCNKD